MGGASADAVKAEVLKALDWLKDCYVNSYSAETFRFECGLQIIMGSVSGTGNFTVTLPMPFKDGQYHVVASNQGGGLAQGVGDNTPTTFKIYSEVNVFLGVQYIAIGYWK